MRSELGQTQTLGTKSGRNRRKQIEVKEFVTEENKGVAGINAVLTDLRQSAGTHTIPPAHATICDWTPPWCDPGHTARGQETSWGTWTGCDGRAWWRSPVERMLETWASRAAHVHSPEPVNRRWFTEGQQRCNGTKRMNNVFPKASQMASGYRDFKFQLTWSLLSPSLSMVTGRTVREWNWKWNLSHIQTGHLK